MDLMSFGWFASGWVGSISYWVSAGRVRGPVSRVGSRKMDHAWTTPECAVESMLSTTE
jgi:hypothetical protein